MFKRRFHNCRGVAAVEFAIILPLLLAFLGGVMDFGVAFFVSHTVQNAAREGARLGVTQPNLSSDDPAVIARVNERLPQIALFTSFRPNIHSTPKACPDGAVSVTVAGQSPYFFLQTIGFSTPMQITRTVTMRYENC